MSKPDDYYDTLIEAYRSGEFPEIVAKLNALSKQADDLYQAKCALDVKLAQVVDESETLEREFYETYKGMKDAS